MGISGKTKYGPDLPGPNETMLCAGLPFTGVRGLDTDEIASVRKSWQRLMRMVYVVGLSSFAIEFGMCAGVATFPDSSPLGVGLLLSIFLLAIPLVIANDWRSRADCLARICNSGKVRCFTGVIPPHELNNTAARALIKAKLIVPSDNMACSIEMVLNTDHVYAVNAKRVEKLVAVRVTKGTVRPPDAVELSMPKSWTHGNETRLERRRMSPEEQKELLEYARFRPIWVLQVLIGIGIVGRAFPYIIYSIPYIWSSAIGGVGVAFVYFIGMKWYRLFRFLWRLRRDARFGWVFIVPPRIPPAGEPEDMQSRKLIYEFLPICGTPWTLNGQPAGWRKKGKTKG